MQETLSTKGTTLCIKNMVCDRCIAAVRGILTGAGLHVTAVELGRAVIEGTPDDATLRVLRRALADQGFALIEDHRGQTVERIRNAIVQMVHRDGADWGTNLSDNVARLTRTDYDSASRLFSETMGMTIERYYILQRIERVKELLQYGELTLSQIALRMHYSSTAYLSAQFKSVTGLTPTQYKAQDKAARTTLDRV